MHQWYKDFLCGSISGIVGFVTSYPLDTIKSRLQYHPTQYTSMLQTAVAIRKEEPYLQGFFKGMTFPLINQAPFCAL